MKDFNICSDLIQNVLKWHSLRIIDTCYYLTPDMPRQAGLRFNDHAGSQRIREFHRNLS